MTEMVVISGDIGREKLQSNLTHQHANSPNTQQAEKEMIIYCLWSTEWIQTLSAGLILTIHGAEDARLSVISRWTILSITAQRYT